MIDALGAPQSLLLLGGTSDIGLAIAEAYARRRPLRVVLAARPSPRLDAAAERLRGLGAAVETLPFDATDRDGHGRVIDAARSGGDIDLAVVAFGQLGEPAQAERDPAAAVALAEVNYVAAVSVGVLLAEAMTRQGHGVIVALSSVAGERPRRSNFVYGSTKAGFDAFYTGLGDRLVGSGVRVVVVRPGFVRSKMTEGLPPAPLATTPQAVAEAVVGAVRSGRETVWVPAALRLVMSVLRHLPRAVFRRLPV
ncbi:MAG: decaprenylphospho-beta-D-erythro-pentofuranosid-2-ulose 2-reductase [Actinomycetota bacterium]